MKELTKEEVLEMELLITDNNFNPKMTIKLKNLDAFTIWKSLKGICNYTNIPNYTYSENDKFIHPILYHQLSDKLYKEFTKEGIDYCKK